MNHGHASGPALTVGIFPRLREWWFDACFWSQKRSARCRRNMTQWIETQHKKATKASVCIVVLHPTGIESCKFLFLCHYMLLKFHKFPFWQQLEIRITSSSKDVWLRWDRRSYNGTALVGFSDLAKPCWVLRLFQNRRLGLVDQNLTENRETPTPWLAECCRVMKHFKEYFFLFMEFDICPK